jgi:DNA-binding beta-propeller fold protein YncE
LKRYLALATLPITFVFLAFLYANNAEKEPVSRQVSLPSSKKMTVPAPGHVSLVNNFPATIALTPDRRYAAVLNQGFGSQKTDAHQSISILDLKSNEVKDFPESRLPQEAKQSYFLGLSFSSDGEHLYASIGSISDPTGSKPKNTGNGVAVYRFREGKISPERFIKIPPQPVPKGKSVARGLRKTRADTAIPYPAGLHVISVHGEDMILVANNLSDNVVEVNARDGKVIAAFDLSSYKTIPSSFPYGIVATRDGQRAWCSLWNLSRVAELDLRAGKVTRWISLFEPNKPELPGSHPTALLLSSDEKVLYVTLSNRDKVAVISTDTGELVRTLETRTLDEKAPGGTTPNAIAESADGKYLFVADASLNAVAVYDVSAIRMSSPVMTGSTLRAMGFVPTEWYPTALASAGGDLLIASAKGQGTGPNNFIGNRKWEREHKETAYIPTLLTGSIARVRVSDVMAKLDDYTREVDDNNRFRDKPMAIKFTKGNNPIRHVIYVLKENRTYDQVFGDLKVGNGDPSLTLYGADITPNQHKLALQFGVIDNFYDSGEVSGDGHEWSTAAITSDYNEKTWQIAYRSRERTYDYQGSVAEEFPLDNSEPDIDSPATGYLWDNIADHNITYRIYGEFLNVVWCKPARAGSPKEGTPSPFSAECPRDVVRKGEPLPDNVGMPHGSPSPWPWLVPLVKSMGPAKAALRDHFDPRYPDFNTEYPDQLRADEFLNEFEGFVKARTEGKGTELPSFVLLYLPDDHTNGDLGNKPKPTASVADNDLALGRVVDAVSHSPYWDDTAIFVVEDDAQDGADHVDAHRSIALVISKYSPGSSQQPFEDHNFYTTVNMIHTMETLLNLPPMNQNDAYAPVMAPLFSGAGNQPPFNADWTNRDNGRIYETNPRTSRSKAAKLDFSRPDASDAQVLNAILWRDRKGNTPMPAPRHVVIPESRHVDGD